MAESMIEPNRIIDNEELLRDSLESNVEDCDEFDTSTNKTKKKEPQETIDEHSRVSSSNDLAKVSSIIAEREQKPRAEMKKPVVKRKAKNMIDLNKMNITKGVAKNSYSKMHQKKLGKAATVKMNGEHAIHEETSGPSIAAMELCKQFVFDGILTENDELGNLGQYDSMMLYSKNYGLEGTNQYSSLNSFENDEYRLESTRSSSHVYGGVSYSQFPPVHKFPTSVQSAPADMQAYQNYPSYENSYRSNSLHALKPGETYADLNNSTSSLASTKSGSEHGDSMTYSGIYANTKQNAKTNYKPYTLGDYKRLKKQSKPGGLGADMKSEEYRHKAKKAIRQKEYSVSVKQKNTYEKYPKKERTSTVKEISIHKQEANARRMKALEYAKAIPKPVPSRNQHMWRSPSQGVEKPQTLLDILQQRHEDEKKAIDAMRKDLQAKLKTK